MHDARPVSICMRESLKDKMPCYFGWESGGGNMLKLGVQSQNAIEDANPLAGFEMLKKAVFQCGFQSPWVSDQ